MKKLIPLLFVCLILGACQSTDDANDTNGRGGNVRVKNSALHSNKDRETGQRISRHLESLAVRNPSVNNATAVVLGNFAIVGIDIDNDIERSQVGSIKYAVGETLKDDPNGANAIVVADPDLNARLREISNDIAAGRPVQGILNELADISGRVIPTVPGDDNSQAPYKTTEEPKNQMSPKDRKTLEQEQDRQSNHYQDKNR
ncbi:YhcN/YlaJ family sporulation lipoprotein [Peribacillus deserti]|uniref:YhcN/YlaJ family sporulation lipoprotein n=1 Tax=Peribacillus deserti TaxID=673318 RepID=A0ABS2QH38_9BACI|nr:YhcN/YlaJ family sporulation lipoprotein [Peribacillus deserti]MBM7692412.1 YhcN/YlaJ family sporulation lipoprotein [Peribacillus deserti]